MDKPVKTICPFEFALTPKEWADIKQLAMQIYESKQFGHDQMKCSIAAFLVWSEATTDSVMEEVQEGITIH